MTDSTTIWMKFLVEVLMEEGMGSGTGSGTELGRTTIAINWKVFFLHANFDPFLLRSIFINVGLGGDGR